MSGADEEYSDVILVSDLRPVQIVFLERVTADVAHSSGYVFLPFLSAHSLHRSIGSKLFENRRFPLDEDFQEFEQRIPSDLQYRQLIVSTKSLAENCCCGAHFVLLGISCFICLATERFEDRLEVCIYDKWRYSTEFVVDDFEVTLF